MIQHRQTLSSLSRQSEVAEALRVHLQKSLVRLFEEPNQMNTTGIVDSIGKDVRWAIRTLGKSRGFTAVAVLSLALGIGANTAIFQLVDAVRLRTLPVKSPGELADIRIGNMRSFTGSMRRGATLTNPLWEGIRDRQQSFSGIFAWGLSDLNLAQGGEVRNAHTLFVSGDFFRVLGVNAMLGRTLSAGDDFHGCTTSTTVISHGFWQREYAGDPAVLGRRLTLQGQPFEIVGVTRPGFFGVEVGSAFDAAVPLCTEPLLLRDFSLFNRRNGWWLSAMGRLKAGVTVAQAAAEMNVLSPGLMQSTLPNFNEAARKEYSSYRLNAVQLPPGRRLQARFGTPLQILLAMTGMVLLIACANLANLMLARITAREQEMAVRMAVGASRCRVLQQMLTESLLISICGSLAGLILAQWMSALLVATANTRRFPVFVDLRTDWRVLGFSTLLAILTSIVFGLAPAIRAIGTDPSEAMKASGRGNTLARGRFRLQRAFVIAQVALSMALLTGALLFVRSFRNLMNADNGLRPAGVITASADLSKVSPSRRGIFRNELVARIRGIRGVTSAAVTWASPLSGSTSNWGINIGHRQKGDSFMNTVGPGFFDTLGTAILAGRDFSERDTLGSPPVAIVNSAFARKFFGDENPVGKVFSVPPEPKEPEISYQVVGMVQDAKLSSIREQHLAIAYLPAGQETSVGTSADMVLRASAPAAQAIDAIKRTVAEVNPNIDLEFRLLSDDIHDLTVSERLMAQLAAFFGVLALLLAVIGLYGMMSYAVAGRRQEIGIRMALGADRPIVVKMVLSEAMLLAGAGLVAGSAIALAVGRVGASMLYELQPRDPTTFAFAASALMIAALTAAYLPARRAAGLDPLSSLRAD
jgi:putative ABC transport system permease protein